ncbi:MAG: hypothetical protein JST66_12200 [Bacteroidetes bacterium]|nr:hypothetical protein [Bacteroidota bacterium]
MNIVLVIAVLVLIAWVVGRMNEMREEDRRQRQELSAQIYHTAMVAVRAEGLAMQATQRLNTLGKA